MSQNSNESQGLNPAWNEYLEGIPDLAKPQAIEAFKKWDTSVQRKLQDVRGEYANYTPFKDIVDAGLDPQFVAQAIQLATELQKDPRAITERINATFDLGFVPAEQEQRQTTDDPYANPYDQQNNNGQQAPVDITQNPQFKAMQQAMEAMQNNFNSQQELSAQQQAEQDFMNDMNDLAAKYKDQGGFDQEYVTALMTQGIDGDTAVNRYRQLISGNLNVDQLTQQQTQQNQQPDPVFMGGGGGQGGGIPSSDPVNFGTMKATDLNKVVADYLNKSATPD